MSYNLVFDLAYGPVTTQQLGSRSQVSPISQMRGPIPQSVQVANAGNSAALPAGKRLFYGVKLPGAIKGDWLVKTELTQPAGSAPTAPYTGTLLLNNPAVRTAMHAEPSDPVAALTSLACLAEIFYTDADGESNAVPGPNFDFVVNGPLVNGTESISPAPNVVTPTTAQVTINLGAGSTPVTKRTGAPGDAAALANVVTVGRAVGQLFCFTEASSGNLVYFRLAAGDVGDSGPDAVAPADYHYTQNDVHFALVPTSSGGVKTVNGAAPDANGNVPGAQAVAGASIEPTSVTVGGQNAEGFRFASGARIVDQYNSGRIYLRTPSSASATLQATDDYVAINRLLIGDIDYSPRTSVASTAPGVIAIGNGSAGDASGGLQLGNLAASGTISGKRAVRSVSNAASALVYASGSTPPDDILIMTTVGGGVSVPTLGLAIGQARTFALIDGTGAAGSTAVFADIADTGQRLFVNVNNGGTEFAIIRTGASAFSVRASTFNPL